MNELIDQQRGEQDPQQRQQIFAEIQEILAQDVPYIPLWQQKTYVFAQKTIKGVLLEQTAPHLPFWRLRKE
jgi:peptide/nickel transport system substrate-binding protein